MERRPCRVLVIEDDATIRGVVAEMLLDEGYEPFLAINGQDGLAQLAACRPDLIILDLMMPVLDGVAFRAAQRASDEHAASRCCCCRPAVTCRARWSAWS